MNCAATASLIGFGVGRRRRRGLRGGLGRENVSGPSMRWLPLAPGQARLRWGHAGPPFWWY